MIDEAIKNKDDERYERAILIYKNQLIEKSSSHYNQQINELKKEYTETINDKKNVILLKNKILELDNYVNQNEKIQRMDCIKEAMLYFNQLSRRVNDNREGNRIKNKSYHNRRTSRKNISYKHLEKVNLILNNIETITLNGNRNHNKTMKNKFEKIRIN
jgi:hypothetical protein